MASSAHKHHLHHPNPYDSAATPPPTPSTQPNLLSASDAADSISRLLHRLPPTLTLSLPARRSPLSNSAASTITAVAPLISFSDPVENLHSNIFSACSQHGFFQLIDHNIPSQLAQSAESESRSLFNLSGEEKQLQFPKNWPIGYDADDDNNDDEEEEESISASKSFCLDSTCFAESTALNLPSLQEFTGKMEKLGLIVIEALSCTMGFENPAREDRKRVCSLMWISESSSKPGRMYPYVVGLQYQIRCQKYSLSADSGWVSVSPRVDSVLVTIGDIAQVWSNGKLKKVKGRALPNAGDGGAGDSNCCISMTLLVTLPLESTTVSPLIPELDCCSGEDMMRSDADEISSCTETEKEQRVFSSFSFEDYAWRVYHERRLSSSKDPLVRYKI